MEQAYKVLRETFGFDSFRLSQEAVISRLLVDNENALVLYPTGGGKSLTYQVPALCLDGLTLVISPLISLMKDQVDRLCQLGVHAANLDSTLSADRAAFVKREVSTGSMKLLYVAPERLNNEGFVEMMRRVKISLLAVDESHCISQWGASFRPEYLKIARFAEELAVERVLCLTATATQSVADDICRNFFIYPEGVFRTPVYRPNLALKVEVANNMQEKINKILPLLKSRTGPAILYVTLQKQANEVASLLLAHGLESWVYHAGLPNEDRERVQTNFMESEKGIVCATIAFGMGIDKANIRQVYHLYLPKTLENYSQEVGRAGRDGLPSDCVMFLSSPDIPTLEGFARGETCSEKDLQLWVQEVAMKTPTLDGTLEFNVYEQSRTYDIRPTVLGICYAQLELDYNHIRAITPCYSMYEFTGTTTQNWQKVMTDNTPVAMSIKRYWMLKTNISASIDVVTAAQHSNTERSALAKKISDWEFEGLITTKPSQVRNRYLVLEPLPKDPEGIKNLANLMYQRMLAREDEAIQKIKQVIDFATDDECLATALASHFGDDDAVPGGLCGFCTFCLSGSAVEFHPTADSVANPAQIQAILNACHVRDDPRLLARMAFGITSPRLTANKWSTYHPLFGSMVSVDFNVLVRAFDVECKKVNYQNAEPAYSPPKKRTYSQANTSYNGRSSGSSYSQRGGYGGNRGGSNKRARGSYYRRY